MILCDTGPLVAAFNEADRDHSRCVRFLQENWSRLVVPSLAVTPCRAARCPRGGGTGPARLSCRSPAALAQGATADLAARRLTPQQREPGYKPHVTDVTPADG